MSTTMHSNSITAVEYGCIIHAMHEHASKGESDHEAVQGRQRQGDSHSTPAPAAELSQSEDALTYESQHEDEQDHQ